MTISMHWWSPARSPKTIITEARDHGTAWINMAARRRGRISNFGDAVNPLIIRELTGLDVSWNKLSSARLVSIGSVLDAYLRHEASAIVFGSGLRTGFLPAGRCVSPEKVIAVRGTLTRSKLGLGEDIPIGDPGLGIRSLVPMRGSKKNKKIIIPHFTELNTAAGRQALHHATSLGYEVVLPNEHPLSVATHIAESELVVTSSLHGIVFADALGTPAQLVNFTASKREPEFKFKDYMSVFDITPQFKPLKDVLCLSSTQVIDQLGSRTDAVGQRIDAAVSSIFSSAKAINALI